MFDRLISMTLIVAVVACPLWCSSGGCHAPACCAAPVMRSCSSTAKQDCCCSNRAADEEQHAPAPCPEKSGCQGICGGAVIEKSCALNTFRIATCLSDTGSDALTNSRLAQVCSAAAGETRCRDVNHGRRLRTLYSSFLC